MTWRIPYELDKGKHFEKKSKNDVPIIIIAASETHRPVMRYILLIDSEARSLKHRFYYI